MALNLPRLSSLSPFGPIFGKELRVTARRKRTYVLRVAYLGLLLLTLLGAYAGTSGAYGGGGLAARAEQQALLGSAFFLAFSMFCVFAMGLIGPVLTATAIGGERLSKTLPVLLMTPISAWQIVSGKLLSRLLVALTLIGLSLPVLALVRLLGGVEMGQMLGVLCLCAVTAVYTASVGLFLSTLVSRAYAVILLSYAALFAQYFLLPLVMLEGLDLNSRSWMAWLAAAHPFGTTAVVANPFGMGPVRVGWVPCVIVHLVLTGVLVWWSAAVLRRIARKAGEQPAALSPSAYDPRAAPPGAGTRPVGAGAPLAGAASAGAASAGAASGNVLTYAAPGVKAHRPRPVREVSDNPVLWREVRRPLVPRRWQAVVGSILSVGVLLFMYALLAEENDLDDSDTQIGFAVVFNGLGWLLVSVLSATVIAQEKEGDTWTLLLAAPVSGATVVWGKVLGLFRRVMWPAVLMAAHFALFTITGVIRPGSLLMVLWVVFAFNSVWVATGVYLSMRLKRVTTAVILNLLLAVGLYAVVPAVLAVGGELLAPRNGDEAAEQVLWYMPYYYLGEWIDRDPGRSRYDGSGYNGYGRGPGRNYRLPGGGEHVTAEEFAGVAFVAGCLHIGLAALILGCTARSFDRLVGRAPQTSALAEPHDARAVAS